MLPFCNRVVTIARKDIAPVWTRSFPISKQPKTIGEHLRKKRFDSGLRQSEVSELLRVSERTLSLWECDQVYPSWKQQDAIIAYLGYNPFINSGFGIPEGNKPSRVAFLTQIGPLSIGQLIQKRRLELKKTKAEWAQQLGVSIKTLWFWESGRCQPSEQLYSIILRFIK